MKIPNKQARHIAITSSGLNQTTATQCNSKDLLKLIQFLGYVQQDPIQVIARAHDHIVWSRNEKYRSGQIDDILKNERLIFEHFSHDACVLPMQTLPYWSIQFKRKGSLKQRGYMGDLSSKAEQRAMLARMKKEGPLRSRDFQLPKLEQNKERATWSKPKHKRTLDHLWLAGVLAVSKREKFTKYYDLAENVFPQSLRDIEKNDIECIDWLIEHAMDRLGFATYSEIKGFWDAFSIDDAKKWRDRQGAKIVDVSVETSAGEYRNSIVRNTNSVKRASISTPDLPKRMKILNPFDPLTRDRKRLQQLFGFDYRIEMYVPAAKRQYGYYVYPLLEYDTFVGRIEIRHDKERNAISVDNLWAEPKIKFGKLRMGKLNSELERLKKLCSASSVYWQS